jgi:hypothetical protein
MVTSELDKLDKVASEGRGTPADQDTESTSDRPAGRTGRERIGRADISPTSFTSSSITEITEGLSKRGHSTGADRSADHGATLGP